jgi:hypothetical protein
MFKQILESIGLSQPAPPQPSVAEAMAGFLRTQNRLLESQVEVWQKYVDFDDELYDAQGNRAWLEIGSDLTDSRSAAIVYKTESDLAKLRNQSRHLANENEFAINAIENRVSYIVGEGHSYKVVPRGGAEPSVDLIDQVKDVIDRFLDDNRWHARQQETQVRLDRDGERFLRYFIDGPDLSVRFVEPEIVGTPERQPPHTRFGFRHREGDVETVEAYYLREGAGSTRYEEVQAAEIQHRKANVDMTAPRGVPLFHAVRKNLQRAEKILRNMSTVAEVQAAIAMVREHISSSQSTIQAFVDATKDAEAVSSDGRSRTYRDYPPGTIIDHGPGQKYTFPAAGVEVDRFVAAIQAELRAVASRLVMPEFMLSSDASNANYSSTMVAEGPAVKMFEREQSATIRCDLEVIRKAIEVAIEAGELPPDTLEQVAIDADGPSVRTRDRLKDAQADQILVNGKVMSRQTWAARNNLDYQQERDVMDQEDEAAMEVPGNGRQNAFDQDQEGDEATAQVPTGI